jgi:DNA helicase-2/ATP-dependent DNA helicase PcrA
LEAAQQRALQRMDSEFATLVKQDFAQRYPYIQAEAVYSRLLSYADELQRAAGEWYKEHELKILLDEKLNPSVDWLAEDIAPLTYLNLLLNGKSLDSRSYDHIVFDEAQDLSPFQFWLLRQYVSSGSMTILGDMAQSIHSYRGLNHWDELDPVFQSDKLTFKKLTRTYRSTHEIVSFANQILAGDVLKEKYTQAVPFERHGAAVELKFASTPEAWLTLISERVASFIEKSYHNIAIITKTPDELQVIHKHLQKAKIASQVIASPNDHYPGGVVIIPVHLTKGMEFEACILANVDEYHYPNTELDGRMLYVACTRPLHELVLIWRGIISPHLAHLQD